MPLWSFFCFFFTLVSLFPMGKLWTTQFKDHLIFIFITVTIVRPNVRGYKICWTLDKLCLICSWHEEVGITVLRQDDWGRWKRYALPMFSQVAGSKCRRCTQGQESLHPLLLLPQNLALCVFEDKTPAHTLHVVTRPVFWICSADIVSK